MKVFLIIVAVLAVIIIAILSLSATVTLVYDKGWHTKIQILFIEKDIVLSKILSFVLFPEKKAEEEKRKIVEISTLKSEKSEKLKELKELIEKNNGSIKVESDYGKGTSFYFYLPLYKGE